MIIIIIIIKIIIIILLIVIIIIIIITGIDKAIVYALHSKAQKSVNI